VAASLKEDATMRKSRLIVTKPIDTVTAIDPHTSFQPIYHAVQSQARVALRFLSCTDRRAELTAESIGLAWLWHVRLCRQGKDGRQFPTALARFALRSALSGRRLVGQDSTRDVMSSVAHRRHGISVQSYSTSDHLVDELFADALTECTRCRVPDLAHVRVEFPRWLMRMSARNRRFVMRAAAGHSTADLAKLFQISKARISQMRRELASSWNAFCAS
jgi:hypothetical protein